MRDSDRFTTATCSCNKYKSQGLQNFLSWSEQTQQTVGVTLTYK